MSAVRVAVDVGGTFTDVCVMDESTKDVRVTKVPTSADVITGVVEGVGKTGVKLRDVTVLTHGTTVATNALITRTFPRAAMVTTRGFRDVIEIRRGNKEDLWDTYKDVAPPLIRRRDRLVVSERTDYAGRILEPLDELGAREVGRVLRKRGISTVAVCFINSFANPANEERMRAILEEELDGGSISISSEVLPEISEHERFSTTVANAALSPLIGSYVEQLDTELRRGGYAGDLLILHSGGGVMTPKAAAVFAARLAGSGIAAGALSTRYTAGLCGLGSAIGLDMGGTSADISLTYNGEVQSTREWQVEFGHPICFPGVDVLTIGAGGGSLAWIDRGGALRNGPQSAGASPGPVCYGQGNLQPTNTDANVVLGRLGAALLGGEILLDVEAAEHSIRTRIAEPLGLTIAQAAAAITQVANANMANGVRLQSVRRGYDPREFVLVCFGGAGPLHGAAVAHELSIPSCIVPPNPGTFSAFGCLLVDIRHDLSSMFLARADRVDAIKIEEAFRRLESEARERLAAEGISTEAMALQRTIDMRYLGQWRSLPVDVDAIITSVDLIVERFHERHQLVHRYRRDRTPVEIYRLNVVALGVGPKIELPRGEGVSNDPLPVGARSIYFDGEPRAIETPIYSRDDCGPETRILGPAVVDQFDSTVLIPPGATARVDPWSNLHISFTEE